MLVLDEKTFSRAIDRSKLKHNAVKPLDWRVYEVTTPDLHRYIVRFAVRGAVKLASCTCAATGPCHHIPSAYCLHYGIAKIKAGK